MSDRPQANETSVPRTPRGVRLQFDKRRDQWVLQAPERLFVLDAIALEVVNRCDGEATLGGIVDDLAATFKAPRDVILKDVTALLQDLADKQVMTL